MNSLRRRALRHAALAEPIRLRIVDLLSLGDRRPGDLQRDLGISSNLAAHHLGVLERAGIVGRSRSEGDRRRSYVHLVPDALARLGPDLTATAHRVLFVCTGNSARSPLAAAIWRRLSPIPTTSAGTVPAEVTAPGAVTAAERHGLDLSTHTPRGFDQVVAEGDFIVTLCDRAHELLRPVTVHWSVPNPAAIGTDAAYETAYSRIAERVGRLSRQLSAT